LFVTVVSENVVPVIPEPTTVVIVAADVPRSTW